MARPITGARWNDMDYRPITGKPFSGLPPAALSGWKIHRTDASHYPEPLFIEYRFLTMEQYDRFFTPDLYLDTPRVTLRLLKWEDAPALYELGQDADIWKYFVRDLSTRQEMDAFIADALRARELKTRMPFTIIDKDTGRICGSTSFSNISFYDQRIEIGWSWLGKEYQGMGINKPCFFALYSFAFGVMNMQRVEAKTDVLNEQARAALLKVGMIPEGVLRSHMVMAGGRRRDTLYFSMLKSEWPERSAAFFSELL